MNLNTPLALYKSADIRRIEQRSGEVCPDVELMQRAGLSAFKRLVTCWPKAKRITIFCGKGNNGGDGYVLAKLAKAAGLDVMVRHVGRLESLASLAKHAMQACGVAGVDIQAYSSAESYSADIMVDALLGIGLNAPVEGEYAQAIASINNANKPVLALDVPSGIQADTGKVCGVAVRADQTITFIAFKPGLLTGQAPAYCGEIVCAALDLPATIFQGIAPAAESLFLSGGDFPLRSKDAHKGDFGHVLVVGGNSGMGGAVCLAAQAAARVGAGLVTVATQAEHMSAIMATRPELMCCAVRGAEDLEPLLARATVVLVGAGLGQNSWAVDLYAQVLASSLPKVMDADALNLLAQDPVNQPNWILTPHPKEASRLLGCSTQAIQADRFLAVQQLQQRYGGVVVLKGVGSIVQATGIPSICRAGNPGMASGGMGDVLGGVIAGLMAQHFSLSKSAGLGTLLHALAADRAALEGQRGLLAMDLMPHLRRLVNLAS